MGPILQSQRVNIMLLMAIFWLGAGSVAATNTAPLPPFEDWQRVALAPSEWQPDVDVIFESIGSGGAPHGRVLARRGSPATVSMFLWDGAAVAPAGAVASYGGLMAAGVGTEPLAGADVPPSFGDGALSVAHLVRIGTATSVTVRIAWRYEGWTLVLSAAVVDTPDAVRALTLHLAERQRARLEFAFSPAQSKDG